MIDSLDLRTLQKESARALIVMQNADNLSLSEIITLLLTCFIEIRGV